MNRPQIDHLFLRRICEASPGEAAQAEHDEHNADGPVHHWPNTFLISPIFDRIWPSTCSACPSLASSGLFVAFPTACFRLPFSSCSVPATLSVLLEFMCASRLVMCDVASS